MEIKLGQKFRVRNGEHNRLDRRLLQDGDIVEVIGIYPHMILVKLVNGVLRQGIPRNSWKLDLEVI